MVLSRHPMKTAALGAVAGYMVRLLATLFPSDVTGLMTNVGPGKRCSSLTDKECEVSYVLHDQSLRFDPGILDHIGPFDELDLNELPEFIRRA
jgi:hypothetical protein